MDKFDTVIKILNDFNCIVHLKKKEASVMKKLCKENVRFSMLLKTCKNWRSTRAYLRRSYEFALLIEL